MGRRCPLVAAALLCAALSPSACGASGAAQAPADAVTHDAAEPDAGGGTAEPDATGGGGRPSDTGAGKDGRGAPDAAWSPESGVCPAEPPSHEPWCESERGGLLCTYGAEACCCNRCTPVLHCYCHQGGRYRCNDWCETTWCDDGCDPWMLRTVEGCLYCSQILDAADAAIEKASEPFRACEVDSDCIQVTPHYHCGKHCPIISRHEVEAWRLAQDRVHADYCTRVSVCLDEWCHDDGCDCPAAEPRCVDGACRSL